MSVSVGNLGRGSGHYEVWATSRNVKRPTNCHELLWSRAASGDGAAFGVVFDRHVQAVHRQCRRLAATFSDAEDLTSLVFVEAWRRRDRVRFVNGSARPWLLVTAANLARNASRARRRYDAVLARLPRDEAVVDVADEVVENLATLDRVERVRAAMLSLRRQECEAITLCDLAELSYTDAAAALNVSVGTVKSRLSRGRARLREALAAADDPAEHQAVGNGMTRGPSRCRDCSRTLLEERHGHPPRYGRAAR